MFLLCTWCGVADAAGGGLHYAFGYDNKGNLASVTKNGSVIEQHTHAPSATTSYYPNSTSPLYSIARTFDKYGRLTDVQGVLQNIYAVAPKFNADTGALESTANSGSSDLAMAIDSVANETTRYMYDEKGRVMKITVAGKNNFSQKKREETFTYDAQGRLVANTFNCSSLSLPITTGISYEKIHENGLVRQKNTYTQRSGTTNKAITETIGDNFNRPKTKTITLDGKNVTKHFIYDKHSIANVISTLPNGSNVANVYEFDNRGRIVSDDYKVSLITDELRTYAYDDLGRLQRENNTLLDKTFVFWYDNDGNITEVRTHNYAPLGTTLTPAISTKTFTYDTTHKDRLVEFDGKAITYNANGEMASFDGWDYSWSKGRLTTIRQTSGGLSRIVKPNLPTSSKTHSFTYNAFGQRVGASYTYIRDTNSIIPIGNELLSYTKTFQYDHSGRLMAESCSRTIDSVGNTQFSIVYLYDQNVMIGMEYTTAGQSTLYYFQRNLQGDVIGIYDTDGNLKVRYIYDAWGNCTIGSGTVDQTLAKNNPIRYRGYYYDTDIGLYYLNARYYSPELRRFISPDDTAYLDPKNANGLNLYVYCYNDPVNYADPSGHLAFWLAAGLVIGAIGLIGGGIYTGIKSSQAGNTGWDLVSDIAFGAAIGGIVGFVTGALVGAGVSGLLTGSFLSSVEAVKAGATLTYQMFRAGGVLAAGYMMLDNLSNAFFNHLHVFWSGGDVAKNQAMSYANQNGGITLEMTRLGKYLETLPYNRQLWEYASQNFANQVSNNGIVRAILYYPEMSEYAIWFIEKEILIKKMVEIIIGSLH